MPKEKAAPHDRGRHPCKPEARADNIAGADEVVEPPISADEMIRKMRGWTGDAAAKDTRKRTNRSGKRAARVMPASGNSRTSRSRDRRNLANVAAELCTGNPSRVQLLRMMDRIYYLPRRGRHAGAWRVPSVRFYPLAHGPQPTVAGTALPSSPATPNYCTIEWWQGSGCALAHILRLSYLRRQSRLPAYRRGT